MSRNLAVSPAPSVKESSLRAVPVALSILVALALVFLSPSLSADDGILTFTSQHYEITGDLEEPKLKEALVVLEAFYEQAKTVLKAKPKESPLKVNFFSTQEKVNSWMASHGGGSVNSGGIYLFGTKTANLYVQGTWVYTRHLLVHECAHQFSHLSVFRNDGSVPVWVTEGVAELFGNQSWEDGALSDNPTSLVRLNSDYRLVQFKDMLADKAYDFASIFADGANPSYQECWAVTHFLANSKRYKAKLLHFYDGIRRGGSESSKEAAGRRIFKSVYGHEPKEMEKELRQYFAVLEPLWELVWVAWDGGGQRIIGESSTNALLLSRRKCSEVKKLSVTVDVEAGSTARGGLIVGSTGVERFTQIGIDGRGSLLAHRRNGNDWRDIGSASVKAGETGVLSYLLEVRFSGNTVSVLVDNAEMMTLDMDVPPAEARFGLFARGGKAVFRGFAMEN